MKVKMKKTHLFYIFGSPVTVRRGENIHLNGLEGEYLSISSSEKKNARLKITDGSVILKPYEMPSGLHELSTVDGKGEKRHVGSLSISAEHVTLAEIGVGDGMDRIAVFLDNLWHSHIDIDSRLAKLEKETHTIRLVD